jgi:hypothetical protein
MKLRILRLTYRLQHSLLFTFLDHRHLIEICGVSELLLGALPTGRLFVINWLRIALSIYIHYCYNTHSFLRAHLNLSNT